MPLSDDERLAMLAEYKRASRREAAIALVFGTAMLGLCFFVTQGDVPVLRQGRLVLGFAVGVAALAYGAWKWLNADFRE